jgi:anti-sigma regulatory factor (Ser/Thr protein kinase)
VTAALTLARSAEAPRRARAFAEERMLAWGVGQERGPVLLALSELVTNAVTHGRGHIDLRLDVDTARSVLHVEVADEGDGRAAIPDRDGDHARVGGWGLRMVADVADAWGTETPRPGRNVVWFDRSVTLTDGRTA